MKPVNSCLPRRPARWAIVLAFTLVYLSWGTTYLAIKEGARTLPPALFGGVRVGLAGLVLLAYLALRGEPLRLSRLGFLWVALSGLILFVGGNGLITVALADETVPTGVASVLVATTPLWIALLETLWPWGDRLRARGWLGLFMGLGGVCLLLAPQFREPAVSLRASGLFLVLASASSWALGSVVLRYRRWADSHLTVAAYQMLLGGGSLALLGLTLGEAERLTPEKLTPAAVFAFFYLLAVGSLVGFVAYNWLLGHVSATLAGTYAYVNPVVAILVGWLLAGEEITGGILGGMIIILAGVALVQTGGVPRVDIMTR